jgi:hypothetical protein
VFQGTDFKHYYAAFDFTAWSPTAEAVGAVQSSGPTPAAILASGSDATIAFFQNSANTPTVQSRLSAVWGAATALSTDTSFVATPSIIALSGGTADMMVVFIRQSDGAVMFSTHGTTWSAPTAIASATAIAASSFGPIERVGLAPLSGGGAIVTYRRASDGALEWATYSTASGWSTPAAISPALNPIASPALARGIGTDTAELAVVESDGAAYHSRLRAGAWTTPIAIGGSGLTSIAIASAP